MDVAIQPKGFDVLPSGVHAKNKTTGQQAKWNEDLTAWVDPTTGKPIPRAESISADPPNDPPFADECRRLRWRQAFLDAMASTYRSEAAHAESAATSEEANVDDNAKAFSKHSGHPVD